MKLGTPTLAALLLLTTLDAQQPAPKSIACKHQGSYTGNVISPKFALTIQDAAKTWEYTYEDDYSGTKKPTKSRTHGTYELRDGLAIFTGTSDGGMDGLQDRELRLGLNYGFPKDQVAFNRFFPAPNGQLVYQRQWYARVDGRWQLAEERRLTLTAAPPQGQTWTFKAAGEQTVINAAGKKTTDTFKGEYTYRKTDGAEWVPDKEAPRTWFPGILLPEVVDGKLAAVRVGYPAIGEMAGFHPHLAAQIK